MGSRSIHDLNLKMMAASSEERDLQPFCFDFFASLHWDCGKIRNFVEFMHTNQLK